MRGLIGLVLLLVSVAFVWGGAQGVYVGLTNTRPHEMTCAQFAQRRPSKTWLKLADCRLDADRAVTLQSKAGGIEGHYAPLVAKDAETGGPVHLLVRTGDSDRMVRLALSPVYEGMILFGIEEDDRVRDAFDKTKDLNLASNYAILQSGDRPQLGLSAILLAAGLLLGGFLLWRVKRGAEASQRQTASRSAQTAEHLINAATARASAGRHAPD